MRFFVILSLAFVACHANQKFDCIKGVGKDAMKKMSDEANTHLDLMEAYAKEQGDLFNTELQETIKAMRADFTTLKESIEEQFNNLKVTFTGIFSFTSNVASSALKFAKNNAKHLAQLTTKFVNRDQGEVLVDFAKEVATDVSSGVSFITTGVKDCMKA